MVSSYRTAPVAAPPTVIVYRTLGPIRRLLGTALILLNFAGGAFLAAWTASRVTVDCSRALGTCTVSKTYPVYGTARASIPIASIEGTVLQATHDDSSGDTYSLVLKTPGGGIALSHTTTLAAIRRSQKAAFDAFLARDDLPSFHLDYDAPHPGHVMWLLWGIFPLYGLFGLWRRAVVSFDWATKTVLVERSRWPLWSAACSYPVDHVTGAAIEEKVNGDGGIEYRLMLTHRSGEGTRLLPGWSSRRSDHVAAAEAIRTAIRQQDGAFRGEPPGLPELPGGTRST